jgi:prephenate dehydratase
VIRFLAFYEPKQFSPQEQTRLQTVAFQGIHGAHSEQAIRQHFGDKAEPIPYPKINNLFEAMQAREVDCALLPVENAFAGAVHQAYELLMDHDLRIQAEVVLHVHHALLATHGTKLEDLRYVRSHPQALAQCERFLQRHSLEAQPWYDTAGAAKDIAESPVPQTGALANVLAAELYGLDIVEPAVEDTQFNYTRFFVLGHDDPPRGDYNKTSLVFATRHRSGALYECLGAFVEQGLNFTKLESRPRRSRPWEPVFFLDVEVHWQDPACQAALVGLLQRASFVKMLGSYPAVKQQLVGI